MFLNKTYQLAADRTIEPSNIMGELEEAIDNIAGPYSHDDDEVANFILELLALLEKAKGEDKRLILSFVEGYAYQRTSHYLHAKNSYMSQLFEDAPNVPDSESSTERAQPPLTPQTDQQQTVFKLCDYYKFDLHLYLKEDGDKAFEFYVERTGDSVEIAEIYFNTFGDKCSSFNRDGYRFPPRKDRTDFAENITLSGSGEILFLGYKDALAFSLTYNSTGDKFEAFFNAYDEKGGIAQSLCFGE